MPNPKLPKRPLPSWLRCLIPEQVENAPLPLNDILTDSVYYPACAQDGFPIRTLGGNFHSFIYADYGWGRDEVIQAVWRRREATPTQPEGEGFRGYTVLGIRDVTKSELAPLGWRPPPLDPDDGRPDRRQGWIKKPFALWVIFQRNQELDDSHGPERLSLLYICGDGAATYDALYRSHATTAKVLTIINPGTGFGGNWTDFRTQGRILWRVVMQNPHGQPDFLISDNWVGTNPHVAPSYWPEYSEPICSLDQDDMIGIWRKP